MLREYRRRVKEGSVMLAAVEAVTKTDPVGRSRRHDSDVAAQTTAGETVQLASPLGPEPHRRRLFDDERHRRSLVVASPEARERGPKVILPRSSRADR
jgi:hypothetical protein